MQASHHDQPYVDKMHMQAAMKRGCQSPWTAAHYIEDGHLIQLARGACVLLQQKVKRALSAWNGRSHHLLEVSFIQNLSSILRFSALYKFGGIYVETDVINNCVENQRNLLCLVDNLFAEGLEKSQSLQKTAWFLGFHPVLLITKICHTLHPFDLTTEKVIVTKMFKIFFSTDHIKDFIERFIDSILSIFSRSNSANRKWSLKKSAWYKICLILLSEIKFLGHWEDITCICYFMLQALQKSDPSGIYLIQTFYLLSEIKFLVH